MSGMTGASIVFGILFIPANRGIIGEGPIAGSPGLSYRYDSEMGTLQVRQDVGSLGSVLLTEAHIGTDGPYRDAEGNIVGRYLSGSGFIIDTGSLPGFRMVSGSNAAPNGQPQQQNEPNFAPTKVRITRALDPKTSFISSISACWSTKGRSRKASRSPYQIPIITAN